MGGGTVTTFYRHTFTAADTTQVTTLSPDTGSGAMVAQDANHWLVTSNRARQASNTSSYIRTPTSSIGTADYVVNVTVRLVSNTGTPSFTINARGNTLLSTDRYTILCNQASGLILRKTVSSTTTVLGTHSMSWTLNQDYLVQLVCNGDQIEAWLDGTRVLGPFTDTSLTAEGHAGLTYSMSTTPDATTGWHTDTFDVSDDFPGAPSGPGFRSYYLNQ
jgi:hypothetical protein